MRVFSVSMPARRAASAVKGLIVEPGGDAVLNARSWLTTARKRPVCGSSTTIAPWSRSTFSSGSVRFTFGSGACAGATVERMSERMRKAGIKVRKASPDFLDLASPNMDRIIVFRG